MKAGVTESLIAGLSVRTFLYGVYLTILVHCLRWLLFEDEGWILRPRPSRLMLTATVLVFALTTGNVGIWFYQVFNAARGVRSGGLLLILIGNVFENTITLLVDSILVYRCWLVYHKSWPVIVVPFLFLLSNIGFFISYTYKSAIGKDAHLYAVGLYSSNIITNLYATSGIIYQILRITKPIVLRSRSDLLDVCRDLVQCGLPYLFTNLFSLILMEGQPKSIVFPMSCAMNSIVSGIVFNLILIRAGFHRTNTQIHAWGSSNLQFPVSHSTGQVIQSGHRNGGIVLEKFP